MKLHISCVMAAFTALFSSSPSNAFSATNEYNIVMSGIEHNINRNCFTHPESQNIWRVSVDKRGALIPNLQKLGSDQKKRDAFYEQQAIYEYSPVSKDLAGTTVGLGGVDGLIPTPPFSNANSTELVHDNNNGFVYLHLIPCTAAGTRFGWHVMRTDFIHNPGNVLKLSESKLDDPKLQSFRNEWIEYFIKKNKDGNTVPSLKEVTEKARKMRLKYRTLFD